MFIAGKKINLIAVVYGGWSTERKISCITGKAIIQSLSRQGFRVVPFLLTGNNLSQLFNLNVDFVYIALHGIFGEDGTIQSIFKLRGIPFSGSDVLASALAMNKVFTKQTLRYHKLPTPDWVDLTSNQIIHTLSSPDNLRLLQNRLISIGSRWIVKPAEQGSTVGISVVKNIKELNSAITLAVKYSQTVLIEKYISGREFTVGILGNLPLPVVEIIAKRNFYDYNAKYRLGESVHIVPAKINPKLTHKLQKYALRTFEVLGCRAVARIDFRVSLNNEIWILEINTIPGMTPVSLLPEAARTSGIGFDTLVLKIIEYSL